VLNYGVRMRPSYRPAAVALVLAAALSASGCTPDASGKPPASTPSATALFASDEEALAAAEEAYRAYLAAVDEVLQGGGLETASLDAVARGSALAQARADASEFASLGYRTVGATNLSTISLQRFDAEHRNPEAVVDVYVCEDVSQVNLLDANGVSLVSIDRPPLTPFQATFGRADGETLVLTSRSAWDGERPCL